MRLQILLCFNKLQCGNEKKMTKEMTVSRDTDELGRS